MAATRPLHVTVPIETEVLLLNGDLVTHSEFIAGEGLVIHLDVRRRDWRKQLELPAKTGVRWESVREVDVQELSSFVMPIRYRVTLGDGCWRDEQGQRHYFGVDRYLSGLDLQRGVTTVALRAAVMLAVVGCVGLRSVAWLLKQLFHLQISKSSLARWLEQAAAHLPDAQQMAKHLNEQRPISEAHFDEIFPRGWRKGCVLVVRDEHGRLVVAQEVSERSTKQVVAFLQTLKEWGLAFRRFYVDGCKAYRKAIGKVYPQADIQYDYFHVIQAVWRHIWRVFVTHRKAVQLQAAQAKEPEEKARIKALAKRLWKSRGLLFKSPQRMTPEELEQLHELIAADPQVGVLRGFLDRVWAIFCSSRTELAAKQRLGRLKRRPEVKPATGFAKAVRFLSDRFGDMITFLRDKTTQRNSLAETGIRCLRRLEQGHDGFRGTKGRDNYLRLYQAIRYCGWSVYRQDGRLDLPPPQSAASRVA